MILMRQGGADAIRFPDGTNTGVREIDFAVGSGTGAKLELDRTGVGGPLTFFTRTRLETQGDGDLVYLFGFTGFGMEIQLVPEASKGILLRPGKWREGCATRDPVRFRSLSACPARPGNKIPAQCNQSRAFMRILCVCRGNTCRSPMAEGTIRARAEAAGLEVEVDSAGTRVSRADAPPDPRGLSVAGRRGYDNSALRARQVVPEDFTTFDLIVAMDRSTLAELARCAPEDSTARIELFHPDGVDVPDPYYGGPADYEHALDLIEVAAEALIARLVDSSARPAGL